MEKASLLQHQLEQQKKVSGGSDGRGFVLTRWSLSCVGRHSAVSGGRGERERASQQGLVGGKALVQWLCGRLQQTSGEWVGGERTNLSQSS